jgi:hypothetical protein
MEPRLEVERVFDFFSLHFTPKRSQTHAHTAPGLWDTSGYPQGQFPKVCP